MAKKKKPARKTARLTKFDKDLMQALAGGVNDPAALRERMGVAFSEFDDRLNMLVKKKLVMIEAGLIQLTIEGYNKLPKKREKKTTPARSLEISDTLTPSCAAPSAIIEPISLTAPAVTPEAQEEEQLPEPKSTLDLAELLKKGAPKDQSFFVKRQQEKQERSRAQGTTQRTPQNNGNGDEKCELCKAGFKMAVKGGNPKYGHCFCGAAYHKDCYESIVSSNGRCARCGKRMDLILDKQSEESLKRIRNLFD
ncbi:MAG: hypothetical protein V1811_00335 [Candidatus Micrarchaeota archaeon]